MDSIEIESLNLDKMDVEELDRRMALLASVPEGATLPTITDCGTHDISCGIDYVANISDELD
jgi:hypothetical protein